MKQVFLSGKGEVEVFDVPVPGRIPHAALIKNACSLISTGTEGSAVSARGGWLGVLEKAVQSQNRIHQVWNMARRDGIATTWEAVHRKLNDYVAIGYSCAGKVVEINASGSAIKPGDLVACMGGDFANHSEYVVVPTNLISVIPAEVSCDEAAFGAIASIAIQGIRRLELSPGEWVGVMGLGLIGQITVQLLAAMGYRCVGIDLLPQRAAKAREFAGIDDAWGIGEGDSKERVQYLTDGIGLDGMIICASSKNSHPVNLAFDLCRKKGRVSLVGDVGLELLRSKMYQKELELRMSTSYGPGRYDDNYEIRGQDYPLPYVRWTERRNLEFVLDLLRRKKMSLRSLISHIYPVDRAKEGYAQIKKGDHDTYGVLIKYGEDGGESSRSLGGSFIKYRETVVQQKVSVSGQSGTVGLGIIGCGGFIKNVHIPNLRRLSRIYRVRGISSRTGASAAMIAKREGYETAASDHRILLEDQSIDAVLIATRHATHAPLVLEALEAGKHVFVEKPMCITVEEGEQVVAKAAEKGLIVRVGFNRRFSPYLGLMKQEIGDTGTRMFFGRINIGSISNDWSNTPEEGGRLLGEGVHFFDLCNWFMGEAIESVSSAIAGARRNTNPNVMVQIQYAGGSSAQILYTSLGNPLAGKEYFEAHGNGRTVMMDDYQSIKVFGGKDRSNRQFRGDKGHLAGLEEFAAAIQGRSYPIAGADAEAGLVATEIALKAYSSMKACTSRMETVQ